jgi:hypothetical protein
LVYPRRLAGNRSSGRGSAPDQAGVIGPCPLVSLYQKHKILILQNYFDQMRVDRRDPIV